MDNHTSPSIDAVLQARMNKQLLKLAQEGGNRIILEFLINNGAQLNTVSEHGETALMLAARASHLEIVVALIKAGANVHLKNHLDWTALMIAALKGNKEIVAALIKAEPEVNATEKKHGWTALIIATLYGTPEVVDLLINAGAKITIKDTYHNTALNCSALNEDANKAFLILDKMTKETVDNTAKGSPALDRILSSEAAIGTYGSNRYFKTKTIAEKYIEYLRDSVSETAHIYFNLILNISVNKDLSKLVASYIFPKRYNSDQTLELFLQTASKYLSSDRNSSTVIEQLPNTYLSIADMALSSPKRLKQINSQPNKANTALKKKPGHQL